MAYQIEFTPAAPREFGKLAPDIGKRLAPAIDRLGDEPRPRGVVKALGTQNGYRLRVVDYRIVYEGHDDRLTVMVLGVGDRREVYRRRK